MIFEDYQIPYYPSLILMAPNHEIVEQAISVPETTSELVDLLESYGLITIGFNKIDKEASFEIFPNPASDVIRIRASMAQNLESLKIYTAIGEELILKTKTAMLNNNITVDISFLDPGIYLLSVENETGFRTTKTFIKR